MQQFEALKATFQEAETNAKKFSGGNKTAGARLRKNLLDIVAQSKELRKAVLSINKSN